MTNQIHGVYRFAVLALLVAGSQLATAQPADLNITPPAPGLQTRSMAALQELFGPGNEEYTIGDGDEIDIQVIGRPELSGRHLVGPDGRITLPMSGSYEIKNLSRDEAAKGIAKTFEKYYTSVEATVRVVKYGSNRVLVLGKVGKPGVMYFDNTPTLMEALTKSGAATSKGKDNESALPNRCAIFRGKDVLAWIDLKSMLDRGDAIANLRLRRDDVLYVPDDQDVMVSVLGEVQRPGMVKIDPKSTLLEVLALSGGLTAESGKARIEIVRQSDGTIREIPFHDLLNPAKSREIPLQRGDVIYVQKGGFAKFAYSLQKISPLATFMLFGGMLAGNL